MMRWTRCVGVLRSLRRVMCIDAFLPVMLSVSLKEVSRWSRVWDAGIAPSVTAYGVGIGCSS